MSLAWRILLVVLLTNLLVVGGVQAVLFTVQQDWLRRQQSENVAASLVPLVVGVYKDSRSDDEQVRGLLRNPIDRLEDVVVTSGGRPPLVGMVFVNPRGAVHRDPDRFRMADVLDGFERARRSDGMVPVGDGFCVTPHGERGITGHFWFVPRRSGESVPSLPLWLSVCAVLSGSLVFGALLYWLVSRTIGRPLQRVSDAAVLVGGGDYAARLPALHGVRELDVVVESFNAMAQKVQSHTGELQRAVTAAVDDVKQKERALVLSSRLASVGTLAAGIAHEINNPIGGMQNAVHRLLQDPNLGERQRTYLQLVQDGLQRIARTARKVLDFSPRAVVAQPFAPATAVEGARALVEHRLQRQGVRFTAQVPSSLPKVMGDAHEIQQVLLNLFLNSLDALQQKGQGGAITVTGTAIADGRVRLLVEDDGPGMETKDLGRVMDPFFSKKERPDASGLGMFISYSIVRNHGGEMSIDSAPGQGFRTTLTLPAVGALPSGGGAA